MPPQVTPTQRLQGADAVLAVRTKVSQVPSTQAHALCLAVRPDCTPLQVSS